MPVPGGLAGRLLHKRRRHNKSKHTKAKVINIYVVVGISNSVLSILTANFPVRIEKKRFV